jgi:hypothetical protein
MAGPAARRHSRGTATTSGRYRLATIRLHVFMDHAPFAIGLKKTDKSPGLTGRVLQKKSNVKIYHFEILCARIAGILGV